MNDKNREFWEDGADYENYVYSELNDDRKQKWKKRINLHIKAPMKILDAGCGGYAEICASQRRRIECLSEFYMYGY